MNNVIDVWKCLFVHKDTFRFESFSNFLIIILSSFSRLFGVQNILRFHWRFRGRAGIRVFTENTEKMWKSERSGAKERGERLKRRPTPWPCYLSPQEDRRFIQNGTSPSPQKNKRKHSDERNRRREKGCRQQQNLTPVRQWFNERKPKRRKRRQPQRR